MSETITPPVPVTEEFLRQNWLVPVEQSVLGISTNMTADDVLSIYDRIQFYKSELARIHKFCEKMLIEWIRVNGDIEVRTGVRYYVGTPKKTKCINLAGAVDAILTQGGGDVAALVKCLASDAIKHGEAAKLLSLEMFERLFEVTYPETLEEGKPVKKLLKSDDAFVKVRK